MFGRRRVTLIAGSLATAGMLWLLAGAYKEWALEAAFWDAYDRGDAAGLSSAIAHGMPPNPLDRWEGNRALDTAAGWGNTRIMEVLVRAGAGIDQCNALGNTALMEAAGNEQVQAVEWLIANGADVSAKRARGGTALTLAAFRGEDRTIPLLVAHGAEVYARDSAGKTSLRYLREYANEEYHGVSAAAAWAMSRRDLEMARLLKAAGAWEQQQHNPPGNFAFEREVRRPGVRCVSLLQ